MITIKDGVKSIVKKAVIPIAGYGTRLFPATKAVPKALFPIISQDGFAKPVIQLIIEEALTAGAEEVCLVAQPQQVEPIADYFSGTVADAIRAKSELAAQADRLEEIGERLHFAIQAEPQGFGHAIYCAKEFAAGEPVIILLGDHLYISESNVSCAKQLTAVYERVGQSVTSLDLCPESELSVNGIVHGNPAVESSRLYTLTQISEKPTVEFAQAHLRVEGIPEQEYLCNFGIDLLTPLLFDILDYNYKHQILTHGEIQLRDAMSEMIRQEGMYGYRVAGKRYDTGNPQELLRTVYAFGLQSLYREVLIPLGEIRAKIRNGQFELSEHAVEQSGLRHISLQEVREVIEECEVIENYPNDKYGPSCLILGFTQSKRPLHIQCSYPSRPLVKIITLYEPDPLRWIDFKTREENV